ncbi:hypothetical protein THER_1268 [Thermodesulfovibrio sp. N1]|nr:hypothetical protein THER_1268 [Thermodesulfovibrio sp. N1]
MYEIIWAGKDVTIYIPHGSDETDPDETVAPTTNKFISHMVQMKQP